MRNPALLAGWRILQLVLWWSLSDSSASFPNRRSPLTFLYTTPSGTASCRSLYTWTRSEWVCMSTRLGPWGPGGDSHLESHIPPTCASSATKWITKPLAMKEYKPSAGLGPVTIHPCSTYTHTCNNMGVDPRQYIPLLSYCFFFLDFFSNTFTLQLLDKPWSQVASLLSPGSCLQFLSRIRFSNPTARRFFIECCWLTLSRFPQVNLCTRKSPHTYVRVCTRGDLNSRKKLPMTGSKITWYATGATGHVPLPLSPFLPCSRRW